MPKRSVSSCNLRFRAAIPGYRCEQGCDCRRLNLFSKELESGNAIGAFLQSQTPAPVQDKISGPMGARFLSSTALGSGNLIG